MKAITIKQPWAHLICSGIKDIENRTWPTKFKGRVLVHAAAKSWLWHKVLQYISPELKEFAIKNKWTRTWLENLHTGSIIGSVEIVDCVINHKSIWAEKTTINQSNESDSENYDFKPIYNWVLKNPIMFPEPIPAKGKLNFWEYPNILAATEEENGELFCHCHSIVDEKIQVAGDSRFGYYCRYCGGKWYK